MSFLDQIIQDLFLEESESDEIIAIGGGCIHQAGMFRFNEKKYFLKWNANASDMFAKEANGLNTLKLCASPYIKIPEVIGHGNVDNMDYLCLEFIDSGIGSHDSWENLGKGLALLHKNTNDGFGLDYDNYIGTLRQSNHRIKDWVQFFIYERLEPLIKMGVNRGYIEGSIISKFNSLFSKLNELLPVEQPALLHGDLWSGNFLFSNHSVPVLFDPAIYYGHREAEIAFTKLFGGFQHRFYQSYNEAYPLQIGHEERVDLFNLYPLLVHVNLFGSSYMSGIKQTLSRFT